MQARTLLAITSVLQLIAILLNFTLATYVIYLTLPFAVLSFFGVFLAIYCGWRTGIWIFIGCNVCLMAYSIVMICLICYSYGGPSIHPLDFTWNVIQISAETLCIGLAIWVLIELSYEDSKKNDDEEKQPLKGRR